MRPTTPACALAPHQGSGPLGHRHRARTSHHRDFSCAPLFLHLRSQVQPAQDPPPSLHGASPSRCRSATCGEAGGGLPDMSDPWYEQPNAAQGVSRFKEIMAGPGNREVVQKLVRWTVLMFTAPFIAYFGCTNLLDSGPIWAGVAAIVVVQVVIFGYVFVAFTEDMEVDRVASEPEPVPAGGAAAAAGSEAKKSR